MLKLRVEQMLPLIREVIGNGGSFTLYPRGTSMLPLIREGVDAVELVAAGVPARGDIVLFRRRDGSFVLHRIVGVSSDGYTVCGDHQHMLERGITPDCIEAKVAAILRDGVRVPVTDPRYLRYVRSLAFRRARARLRARIKRIFVRER